VGLGVASPRARRTVAELVTMGVVVMVVMVVIVVLTAVVAVMLAADVVEKAAMDWQASSKPQ
jgi:uncharacterized membrane protein